MVDDSAIWVEGCKRIRVLAVGAGTRFNLVYSAAGRYGASQIHFGFANIQLYYQFPINVLLLYAICWQNDACFTFNQMF